MIILEKVDWKILNDYIDNNLIIANKHPEYDIWILNYSPKVKSKNFWDDYTLSSLGLVVDMEGNILARPFTKFNNYEEYDPSEFDMSQEYDIFEQIDGDLIILFYYEPRMEWILASRRSFISDQMLEAQKMIDASIYEKLNVGNTYLFEIIFPENRFIVDYSKRRELVLLTRIETNTGVELFYDDLVAYYSNFFTIVKRYKLTINNLDDLKKLEEENQKGFVVRFLSGFRVKVKFSEYVRLDDILTNVSNLTVWEHLKNYYNFDILLDRVPDEFYNWLKKTVNIIQSDFNEIERQALKEFIRIYYVNGIITRKEFAAESIKFKYPLILFKLYDKKTYDELIWDDIRPEYSKPFLNKENN